MNRHELFDAFVRTLDDTGFVEATEVVTNWADEHVNTGVDLACALDDIARRFRLSGQDALADYLTAWGCVACKVGA